MILILVGIGVGGLILGLLLGSSCKSSSGRDREVIREVVYKDEPE